MLLTQTEQFVAAYEIPAFNRYQLTYSAAVPLQATLTYTQNGAEKSEVFFLEAGENRRFSSFTDGYLQNLQAEHPKISAQTITHASGELILHAFAADVVPVPAEKTFFFENARYRVGVELCWGGGLSYLADKACPIPELPNLLNNWDTGRLIQQSYYGTSDPPYRLGRFMDHDWPYNPVQGGDRGNHKSKLIEATVSEHEVYIKCRPRDWGHDGGWTDSYMENWYRLVGDEIVVENRFVDFSGFTHPKTGQEVPAFYTVSYLDHYHYYNGTAPWTNGALTCLPNLPFWAGGEEIPENHYALSEENSETWSAFTDASGYGLGLFTPDVHRFAVGRYQHDASKAAHAPSCSYIAPVATLQLRCFEPVTYRYYLAAGTLPEIRARFEAHQNEQNAMFR